MGPNIRLAVGFRIRRAGAALAIVDSRALLAAIESKPRCWLEGSQQPRGLEPCESVGPEAARGPFKQELIHASVLEINLPGAQVDVTVRGLRLLGQVRQVKECRARIALLQANPAPFSLPGTPGSLPRPPSSCWVREGVSAHAIQQQMLKLCLIPTANSTSLRPRDRVEPSWLPGNALQSSRAQSSLPMRARLHSS